jgi:UDPglucose--hexose-1-phosphate uridylyltransferase
MPIVSRRRATKASPILPRYYGAAFTPLRKTLDDPPFNLLLITAPRPAKALAEKQIAKSFHWHLQLVPRTTRPAGLELATGLNLNPLPPESAARRLREALGRSGVPAGTVKR